MMSTRLSYLDSFRALVMLMVVFCHTCGNFCLDCQVSTWYGRAFAIVMLPGFFFVSGWFSHIILAGGVIAKRLTRMLLPTVLMFLLYVYAYWGDMEHIAYCASGEYKFGYWFTFALFLMNVLHWGVSTTIGRWCRHSEQSILLALGIMAIGLIMLKDWDWYHNRASLANLISLRLIAMNFPYYLMGMVCRYRQDVLMRPLCG